MATSDNITITETGADGTEQEFEITTGTVDDLAEGDQAFAGEAVEAMFDDGSTDHEAAYMDYDGDGKIDAAGVDADGDGNLEATVFDTDGDGVVDATMTDTDGDGQMDEVDIDGDGVTDYTLDAEGLPTEEEISTNSVEFTVGEDGFPIEDQEVEFNEDSGSDTTYADPMSPDLAAAPFVDEAPIDGGYSAASDDNAFSSTTAEEDAAAAA